MSVFQDLYETKLAAGHSHEQAYAALLKNGCPPPDALAIQAESKRVAGIIKSFEPVGPQNPQHSSWYSGPKEGDRHWPALFARLGEKEDWTQGDLRSLDEASSKIMSRLKPPMAPDGVDSRGLVMGYVQSGKTASYTALMAKAADRNYKVLIVLTGIHNALRGQTQTRLNRELIGVGDERHADATRCWIQLTGDEDDFSPPHSNANALLGGDPDKRLLIVCKKNARIMTKLISWLEGAHVDLRTRTPVLVIDDEADQASINTSRNPARVTAINQLLRRLLRSMPRSAYVAYTATPFANLLINPDPSLGDLYPKGFILALPKAEAYFGPERIFGRDALTDDELDVSGMDVVRIIPDDELPALRPGRARGAQFDPTETPSLRAALLWFVLSSAARLSRGHVRNGTMLVHTSLKTETHRPTLEVLSSMVQELRTTLSNEAVRVELSRLWQDESARVTPEEGGPGCVAMPFDRVYEKIAEVLNEKDFGLVEDNYLSSDRLSYDRRDASFRTFVVVVGGNTLSRGLTLEGLTSSLFLRTSNTYDTLLQMGRWFGYRKGYGDLFRVWTTQDLRDFFQDISTVEEEIRRELKQYDDGITTPTQAGVRIRRHPQLQITAAPKMGAAVSAQVSYSDRRVQSILFHHKTSTWIDSAWSAGVQLVKQAATEAAKPWEGSPARWVAQKLPVARIVDFFSAYPTVDLATSFRPTAIRDYILRRNKDGELLHWNVAIIGRMARGPCPVEPFGGLEVRLVNRSRIQYADDTFANIKALMSTRDIVADVLPELPADQTDEAACFRHRREHLPGVGLLLLYPIDKASTVSKSRKKDSRTVRLDLEASGHLLGVGLVFPASRSKAENDYVVVDLSTVPRVEDWDHDSEETDDLAQAEQESPS